MEIIRILPKVDRKQFEFDFKECEIKVPRFEERSRSLGSDPSSNLYEKVFNEEMEGKKFPKIAGFYFKDMDFTRCYEQIFLLNDPLLFKEAILRSLKLYYDGINEGFGITQESEAENIWKEQSVALESLIKGVKKTVVNYYSKNDISYEEIRNMIFPYEETLKKYSSRAIPKSRNLDGQSIEKITDFAEDVVGQLKERPIDSIVPIASGGFEPGVLVADQLNVDQLIAVRCSARVSDGSYREDALPSFPRLMPEKDLENMISGKNILIVEDIISTGLSMDNALSKVYTYSPKDIYIAIFSGHKAAEKKGYKRISKYLFTQ